MNTPQSIVSPSATSNDEDSKTHDWKGIQVITHPNPPGSSQYFGPASTFAFMGRITAFLNPALDKQAEINQLCPEPEQIKLPTSTTQHLTMQRHKEELFLNLIWQIYPNLVPILSESEFGKLYTSLWLGDVRLPSPLVDVLLALCIQYGRSFMTDENGDDIASRFYFDRCRQQLLSEVWDYPSLDAVQAYIFMVVYLRNSALFTAARSTMAQVVSMAYSLGLHLYERGSGHHRGEVETRIWRSLFVLDMKLSMELDLPPLITSHKTSPRNENPLSIEPKSKCSSLELSSGFTFGEEEAKLLEAARTAHVKFFSHKLSTDDVYRNLKELERTAELMEECLVPVHACFEHIPDGLKIYHKDGVPLCLSPSAMVLNTCVTLGIQLQQLCMELEYHQTCLYFYRLFIHFVPHSNAISPKADSNASSALNHSIEITKIIHSTLTGSVALNGFHPAYHYQWAAALTIMAYIFAYPVCTPTPAARKALPMAMEVFEMLGKDIPIALRALAVLKRLDLNAKSVMTSFRKALASFGGASQPQITRMLSTPPRGDEGFGTIWPEGGLYDHDMWADFMNGLDSGEFFLDHEEVN